jgi:Spy/CpxP family protein refolding chaperone
MRNRRALALASLLLLPAFARADDAATKPSTNPVFPPPIREGRGGRFPFMQRERQILNGLKLTDEQSRKVDNIYADATKKIQDMSAEAGDGEGPQRFSRMHQVMADARAQVQALLTDEQKAAYNENLARFREQFRRGMRGGEFAPNGGASFSPPTLPDLEERVRTALSKIDLKPEQKAQVKGVMEELAKNMKPLEEEFRNNPDATVRGRAQELMGIAREKLQAILTPDQQRQLRSYIQQQPAPGDDPGPADKTSSATDKTSSATDKTSSADRADEKMMADNSMEKSSISAPRATRAPRPAVAEAPPTPLIRAGQAAPDFTLKQIDGSTTSLASYKDHVLVVIFGSYTTPTFRERAGQIAELAKDYASSADFLVIYTKESHPLNGWEVDRNKSDQVRIEQPKTETDKIGVAKKAREVLKLNLPFAVDTDKDATATAYGTFPNGAVIIGRDGTVAYAQHWCDPAMLRRHLDDAIAAKVADAK